MKKFLAVIATILVVVIIGYVSASKVWGFPVFGVRPGDESKLAKEPTLSLVSLGQFMTNLVDVGRFVRITVEVEVVADKATELTDRASELKTDLCGLLRSRTYEDLSGEDGLRKLQEDMLLRIDAKCPEVARNVFFSEFIVQ